MPALLHRVDRDGDGVGLVRQLWLSALFFDDSTACSKVLILAVAAINIAGARFIDRAQTAIVIVLLAVFALFIVVTLAQLNPELLAPSTYPPTADIVSSVALTFFAYLGFTVISFNGGDLPDRPGTCLGRCTSHSAPPPRCTS